MSKNRCYNESSCCNPCDGNSLLGPNGTWIYILVIIFIFGGGFGSGSFWNGYNNAFRCSGFNYSNCCNNTNSNNSNFTPANTTTNNTFGGIDLASIFNGLSNSNNFDISNPTEPSI